MNGSNRRRSWISHFKQDEEVLFSLISTLRIRILFVLVNFFEEFKLDHVIMVGSCIEYMLI